MGRGGTTLSFIKWKGESTSINTAHFAPSTTLRFQIFSKEIYFHSTHA